jgi:hypothetical protein
VEEVVIANTEKEKKSLNIPEEAEKSQKVILYPDV